jgi:glycosyltransferase involved in cell wall biosynthesis
MEAADLARSDRVVSSSSLAAVAWARFQPRTSALAAALGGRTLYVDDGIAGKGMAGRPLAYLLKAVRTWMALSHADPQTVLVVTPPVFAPLVAWLWSVAHGRELVVDCHTGAFHSNKWGWARPIHRWLLRRVKVVLLHTDEAEALVRGWGARALLLPDDLPQSSDAGPYARVDRPSVVVAGSLDENEPVAEVVEAARLLPDVEFRFTGDAALLPPGVVAGAPANAVFTGYLPYPAFLGELQAATLVGVFSTDPQIMNRAAFEAVGLGRPMVLSDLAGLRSRFGTAALFCANDPGAIAEAVARGLEDQGELTRRSVALQVRLRAQRDGAVARLQSIIAGEGGSGWRLKNAS